MGNVRINELWCTFVISDWVTCKVVAASFLNFVLLMLVLVIPAVVVTFLRASFPRTGPSPVLFSKMKRFVFAANHSMKGTTSFVKWMGTNFLFFPRTYTSSTEFKMLFSSSLSFLPTHFACLCAALPILFSLSSQPLRTFSYWKVWDMLWWFLSRISCSQAFSQYLPKCSSRSLLV